MTCAADTDYGVDIWSRLSLMAHDDRLEVLDAVGVVA